jgi:predicted AAA+ superfamily ATPase
MPTEREIEEVVVDQMHWFRSRSPGVPRKVDFERYMAHDQVVVISGVRRCGKSTLLNQFSRRYDQFYYLNLDDERLFDFSLEDFATVLVIFMKLWPGARTIFIDEIQNVPGWERFVRRVHDEGYKVYCTGSNANLLSSELGTHLTGRYTRIDLYPFSFAEYLDFFGTDYREPGGSANRASLLRMFDSYLESGGFPEYTKTPDPEILERTYEDILYRDVISRYGVREKSAFLQLARHYFTSIGSDTSYHALKDTLGLKTLHTVRDYTHYLKEAYLVFEVPRYDHSLRKQYVTNKKVYCIDNGMRNRVGFRFSRDLGKSLENTVFIELLRRGQEIYYYRGNRECDFVITDHGSVTGLIQVSYELNPGDRTRETAGLAEAMERFSVQEGLMLTYNQHEEISVPAGSIHVIPVWQWLL